MYKVVECFSDAQDGYHIYKVGDSFPRNGVSVSAERVNALLSDGNAIGKPLIVEVKEVKEVSEKKRVRKK